MRSFPIDRGGQKRVVVQRGGAFQQVLLDGKVVLHVPDPRSILDGMTAKLPDGSELFVKSSFHWLRPGLLVARDGVPLPESDFDPAERGRRASRWVAVLGALQVILGAAPLLVASAPRDGMARCLVEGLLFLALAFAVRRGHRLALAGALALLLGETAYQLLPLVTQGATLQNPGALVFRALFALAMVRGLVGMAPTRTAAALKVG